MTLIPSSLLMMTILTMSTLMAISSSNWLMAWAALELNLLAFIPMMMSSKSNQEIEASTKYFLSQALGSAIMISFSIMMWSEMMESYIIYILYLSLMIKLGAAPCHFWFPSVMASLSWMNCMILTTWQKLAPLMIILFPLLSKSSDKMMYFIAPLNAIIGGIMGLNQSRLKTIIAYSSITHTGWILSCMIVFMPNTSMIYFIMYTLIVVPLFIFMMSFNTMNSSQLNKALSKSVMASITLSILFLSLGGLPPLTGFMPKLMIINLLMETSNMVLAILIIGSLLNLFFYLNVSFNLLMSWQMLSSPNPQVMKSKSTVPMIAMSSLGMVMLIK